MKQSAAIILVVLIVVGLIAWTLPRPKREHGIRSWC